MGARARRLPRRRRPDGADGRARNPRRHAGRPARGSSSASLGGSSSASRSGSRCGSVLERGRGARAAAEEARDAGGVRRPDRGRAARGEPRGRRALRGSQRRSQGQRPREGGGALRAGVRPGPVLRARSAPPVLGGDPARSSGGRDRPLPRGRGAGVQPGERGHVFLRPARGTRRHERAGLEAHRGECMPFTPSMGIAPTRGRVHLGPRAVLATQDLTRRVRRRAAAGGAPGKARTLCFILAAWRSAGPTRR